MFKTFCFGMALAGLLGTCLPNASWADIAPATTRTHFTITTPIQSRPALLPGRIDPAFTASVQRGALQRNLIIEQDANEGFNASWNSVRTFNFANAAGAPVLKVYVDVHSPLYKSQYGQYVTWSLGQWSAALNGRLQYQMVSNPSDADITVNWVTHFSEADQAGDTAYTVGHAAISIKTPGLPENITQANILHEFGHALGLGEHSRDNSDVMVACHRWSSLQEYKTYKAHLSSRDVQAIRRLYGSNWRKGEDVYVALNSSHAAMASVNAGSGAVVFNRAVSIKRASNNVNAAF